MKAIGSFRIRRRRRPRILWTARELQRLRVIYPDASAAKLLRAFPRHAPIHKIYNAAKRHGLRKSPAFHANSKLSGRFNKLTRSGIPFRYPKGHVPANKGLRRPGWFAGRMRETQFKKGRPAHEARNYVPIGTEKFDPKRKVLMRKITDDPTIFPAYRWHPVHRLVWVAAHGAVPPGHICVFKPGRKTIDSKLITADRLEVITLAENMRRNTIWNRYPRQLANAVQLLGQVRRRIRQREREHAKAN